MTIVVYCVMFVDCRVLLVVCRLLFGVCVVVGCGL